MSSETQSKKCYTPPSYVADGDPVLSAEGGLSIIEQVEKTPAGGGVCQTRGRPYLIGMNHEIKRAVYFQPRCKSWGCPVCANTNKSLWAVRAGAGAENLQNLTQLISFLTLTSHEKLDHAGSLAVWPRAWTKLRHRAQYASGGFQYLMVAEQHEDGRLHMHAIETAGLGERWWKDNGRECGLGFMADEEPARTPQGAAWYVVKYLTKSIAVTTWPRGFRRVRTSRGWPPLPEMDTIPGWVFKPLPKDRALDEHVAALQKAGFYVEGLNHVQAWDFIKDTAPEN